MLQQRNSLFPVNYIDVQRKTKTSIDGLHEATIDDYWNTNGSMALSEPWIGVTRFELLHTNPPEGNVWGQGRLTKKQVCTRPGHICLEEWSNTAKSSQRKAMHQWAGEKQNWTLRESSEAFHLFRTMILNSTRIKIGDQGEPQRCLAKAPHWPTRTVQAWGDPVQVIGLKLT